ncbi:hypothetical protein ACNQS8_03500, partial [Corynebacterium diphtheriae]
RRRFYRAGVQFSKTLIDFGWELISRRDAGVQFSKTLIDFAMNVVTTHMGWGSVLKNPDRLR